MDNPYMHWTLGAAIVIALIVLFAVAVVFVLSKFVRTRHRHLDLLIVLLGVALAVP